jgi:Ca-activated chloride channel family protein
LSAQSAGFLRKTASAAISLAALLASAGGLAGEEGQQECLKDTMIVFDASGSMGTTDFTAKKPHIERVKQAFRTVVPEIPPERKMGLIVYGEGAYNRCDSIELRLLPELNAGPIILEEVEKIVPAGRTPLTESVSNAADILEYKEKPAIVVLLTDGEETCGGKPCDLARALKKNGKDITVHVIGYRNKEAGGLGDVFGARCLAEETGGLYLPVGSVDELTDALRKTMTCPLFTRAPEPPQLPKLAQVPRQ